MLTFVRLKSGTKVALAPVPAFSGIFKGIANRGVAQLAARHVRDVEVGSSSLLIPTHQKGKNLERDLAFLFSILLISNE